VAAVIGGKCTEVAFPSQFIRRAGGRPRLEPRRNAPGDSFDRTPRTTTCNTEVRYF
jgi:hypothetical protein